MEVGRKATFWKRLATFGYMSRREMMTRLQYGERFSDPSAEVVLVELKSGQIGEDDRVVPPDNSFPTDPAVQRLHESPHLFRGRR